MTTVTPVILRFPSGAPRLRVVRGDDGDARQGLRIFYGASTPLRRTASGQHVSARNRSGDPACSEAASAWRRKKATSETFAKLAECRAKAKAHGQAKLHRAAGNDLKAQVLEHRVDTGKVGDTHRRQLAFQARNYRLGRQLSRAADRKPAETDPIERGRQVAMRRAEAERKRAETPPTRTIKIRPSTPAHRAAIDAVLSTFRARQNADDARKAHVEPDQVARVNALSDARYREAQAALKAFRKEESIGKPAPPPKPAIQPLQNSAKADAPAPVPKPARPRGSSPPPKLLPLPPSFAEKLHQAAASVPPEGRFGDNKVFIGHLHRAFERLHGPTPIADFKGRLAAENNARKISLSRADQVEAMDPRSVAESETGYLGSTFHFLRTDHRPGASYPPPPPSPARAQQSYPQHSRPVAELVTEREEAKAPLRQRRRELAQEKARELAGVPESDRGRRRAIEARYAAEDRKLMTQVSLLDRAHNKVIQSHPGYMAFAFPSLVNGEATFDPKTGGYYTGD